VVTGEHICRSAICGAGSRELGPKDGATFVHKVENRQLAVEHPSESRRRIESKKVRNSRLGRRFLSKRNRRQEKLKPDGSD